MADMQTSLLLLIVPPSILNPIMHFSTQPLTGEMKCPMLYLCLVHSTSSPSMSMQHMYQHNHKWYDPLHIIPWPYWFIDLDLTCSSPLPRSIGAKSTTCPSLLQPFHQAKSCLDLLHLSHMTPSHVSYAMRSFITYVSLATNPSHLHHHGMSCSHKYTYGLINCVSHI